MPRVPKSIPKKPGPYHARQPLVYRPPPPRNPISPPKPAPESNAKSQAERKIKLQRAARGIGVYVMGACAFGAAFYLSKLYVSFSRHSDVHVDYSPATQRDVSGVYDQTAGGFDTEVNFTEMLSGINKARKAMSAQASGHVLEVSAGTARNLGYYNFEKIKSLTLIDLSPQMVDEARKKWDILNPGKPAESLSVRFMQGDCVGQMPEPPAERRDEKNAASSSTPPLKKGYDTILQTMGLCSTVSPVQLMKNLSQHLDHSNPDARILLIEHGRSYYEWMNKILDTGAAEHADRHGCWWNRDIGQLIEESGLEIVTERRKQFGTVWIFELRPKKVTGAITGKAEQAGVGAVQQPQAQTPNQGWFSWLSK